MGVERVIVGKERAVSCERTRSLEPSSFSFHLHNQYEIYMLLAGDVHYFVEQHKYILQPGDVLLFNSGEVHRPTFSSGAAYERYVVHFDPALPRALMTPGEGLLGPFEERTAGEGNLMRLSLEERRALCLLFERLIACGEGSYCPSTRRQTLLLEMLLLLGAHAQKQQELPAVGLLPEPLGEILAFIHHNLTEDLSLESLARRFYISKNYLCRLFSKHTGNTIHSYIRMKRIALAKSLLDSGHSVSETCVRSGFGDYSNFIRAFRMVTGQPPAGYRKNSGSATGRR